MIGIGGTVIIATLILFVSLIKCIEIKSAYYPVVLSEQIERNSILAIDYELPYEGKINPDNPLWYVKVVRDRVRYSFTFNSLKKAKLNLLFADKRLGSSLKLFKSNKPDLGFSTLAKSEKYLDKASKKKGGDYDYYRSLALSSLKHREIIEFDILPLTPEDLRPKVIKTSNISKETYKIARDMMLSNGWNPPENIFELK